MEAIALVLPYVQIVLAILLTAAILFQQRGAGLGGAFGDTQGTTFYVRRGAEKTLFYATMVLAVLFVASCFIALLIH